MSEKLFHRYGIVKHIKGDSYDNDCLIIDKNYQVLSLSRETAEMMIRQFYYKYGDRFSFRIRRLD